MTDSSMEVAGRQYEDGQNAHLTAVSGQRDVTEVGRQRAIVGISSLLIVTIGRGQPVKQLTRPLEHLASLIRSIHHHNLH